MLPGGQAQGQEFLPGLSHFILTSQSVAIIVLILQMKESEARNPSRVSTLPPNVAMESSPLKWILVKFRRPPTPGRWPKNTQRAPLSVCQPPCYTLVTKRLTRNSYHPTISRGRNEAQKGGKLIFVVIFLSCQAIS